MTQPALFAAPRPAPAPPPPRTYWEHQGPRTWRPVTVAVRYGHCRSGDFDAQQVFPHVRTKPTPPRNVLIHRTGGSRDVVPVRTLRTKEPR